jgi:hypothetical protein
MTLRELGAKYIYLADLTLDDETTVKQLVDLMEKYGQEVARKYYHEGVADAVLGKPKRDLFCEKTNLPS